VVLWEKVKTSRVGPITIYRVSIVNIDGEFRDKY
jgi:hypothetical protein